MPYTVYNPSPMKQLSTRFLAALLSLFVSFQASAQVTASFSANLPSPACNPAVVSFTNTSTGAAPLSYQWNFGVYSGTNSIFTNPSTTYLSCGTFTVSLIVTDNNGVSDTTTQDITINCSPTADFSVSSNTGCAPFDVVYNDNSVPGSGTIQTITWDFGDGYLGNGDGVTHTYTVIGCNTVTQIVTNSFGCTADTTIGSLICVAQQPTLTVSSPNATSCAAPFTTTFDANISGGVGPFIYDWTFQNGTPATDSSTNPSVEFSAAGSYDVSLTVTDVNGCTATATANNYVNVAANTIDISANAFEGCAPFQFDFTGVTNNTPQSYSWSVTETGQTSSGQNASFTFNTPGTYTICLDVDFSGGCTAQKCTTVVVHAPPTAAFAVSGNAPTCIRPSQLTFTNNSTGDTLSYSWSFPGGSPASSTDSIPPIVTYVSCATFSASLIVTDINGCTASDAQNNMFTITCPVADFNVDITGGCIPLTVSFSDSSVGSPVQWEWDFGDGSTGSGSNPSHTFTTEGCFTISLITTSAEGCKDTVTYTDLVCAGTPPDVAFTSNPPVACADEPISFTNNSTNIFPYTTYSWDFVGVPPYDEMSTLMNPTYIYNDTGWFDVTLIASNYGCNDTLTIDNMEHILPPVAIIQLSRTCAQPLVITLDGTQSLGADTYTWVIPGGNPSTATTPTVTVTYTTSGNYSASLYVTNDTTGCDNQATINIPVRDVEAEFTGSPLQGCATLNSCMTNQSLDAVSYQWLVTNNATGATVTTSTQTNPCFSLSNAGVYDVRLIATDMFGCRDTILKPAYITVWRPTAGFYGTPLTGCTPLFVQFTDTSFATTSTIVSWSWNFGDPASGVNNTSTLQNPTHTYNNPGFYNVSLTVTDNHGCTRSLTKSNYVHAVQPNADFVLNNTSVCSGAITCLTNASSGSSLTYAWDFGNGVTSTSSAPCVTYTDTGWYDVTLVVTDSYGCTDTTVKQNYIDVTFPEASFIADTTNSTCPPLIVTFQNTSFGGVSYQWQFGDNSVSSATSPTHIYNQAGSYDVTLIVTNAAGCVDTLVLQDYIVIGGPQATVAAPITSGCAPLQTCFQAFSSTTISYTWNFGDGTVTTGADTICYTYTQPGTFNPELIVDDGLGCIYALPIGQINVGGAMASFIIPSNDLCGPGSITFQDQSTSPFGITSHAWNFGDPASGAQNTSTSTNPTHYFANAGQYIVSLTVTSADGCVSTSQDTVNILDLPLAAFASNDTIVCLPAQIQFTDSSYSAAGIAQWSWDFNDGNTSNQQNPLHDYLAAGTYNVTLTVIDSNGCSDNTTLALTVNPPVTIDAGPDQALCIGGDSVQLAAVGAASFAWSPATGLSATNISNPFAAPAVTTTYTLYSASFSGCDGTDTVVVTVNTPPQIDTVEAYGEVCALSNGQAWATVNGGSFPYTYLWSNGSTDSLVTNLTGNSIYNVTVTDAGGCSTSSLVFVDAVGPPFISQTVVNETCGNANGSISVTVPVGMPPFTYLWNTGATDDFLTNLSAGSYSVTVTDGMNCTSSIVCNVVNQASPVVTLYATNATCENSNGTIDAQVAGLTPFAFTWSNGETTEDIAALAAGTYVLTVSDPNGCSAIDSIDVVAANSPLLSETHVNATCELANGIIDVTTIGGTAPFVYTWNTNYAFTEDLNNVPAGSYDLVVTDANGCTDSLSVTITTGPVAVVSFNITDALCSMANGSVITTVVSGGTAPFTFAWSNGATDQDLTNVLAGAYTVTVTDVEGCTSSATANVNNITGPTLSVSSVDESCSGANGLVDITLSGGTAPFTFIWSNGETTEDINNLSANTYTVTVIDANGCEANITTTLANQAGPILSTNITNSTCAAANGSILLMVAGGSMPYSFIWSNGATTQNISNVLVGTYDVTVTDNTGCTAMTSATIIDNPGINPSLTITTTNSTCDNPSGGVVLTVTSGVGPYTFNWSNGYTTQNLNNVNGGYYSVTVTGSNGCTAVIGDTVGFTNTLTISVNAGNSQCNNPTGTLNAVVSGSGTGPFTYQWSHSSNNISHFNGLPPGVYYLTVTDVNGCSAATSAVIGQSGQTPDADFTFTPLPCENQGVFTFTHSGTNPNNLDAINWYFPTGTSSTGTTASYPSPGSGSFQIIEVVYMGVCTDTLVQNIVLNPLPVLTGTATDVNCSINGSVDITVTSGSSPWTYVWSNGATTEDLSSVSAGVYTVTTTESHGCQAVDTFVVGSTGAIVVNYTTVPSTCSNANGSIVLTVSGGVMPYMYNWSNGSTDSAIYNLAAGSYGVSVTDSTGCVYPLSVTISDNPAAVLSSTQTDAACGQATGSIDLSVVGTAPYTFTWSNGATTEDIAGITAGSYGVTVTDANGCTSVLNVAVNDQGGPVINATSVATACAQAIGQLNATVLSGNAPYTYNWSNGSTLQNVSGVDSGMYYLSVTDALGCMSMDTVVVANTPGPVVTLNQLDATCGNANGQITTVVSGGTSPYSYNWNSGAYNAPDLFNVFSGTYTLVLSDANNCQVLDTITILDTNGPDSISFTVTNADCNQANGLVEATINGGASPYTFAWNNGTTSDSLTNVTAGSYTVTATDANGCTISGNALVGDNLGPTATFNITSATCNVSNGAVDVATSGGVTPYNFVWSNGSTTEDLSNVSPASYNLTVTDASGCSAVITAAVDSVTPPTSTYVVTATTCNQSNGTINVTTTGGTAPFSYSWNNGAYAGQSLTNLATGSYTLTLTDANGCIDSLNALVDAVPVPTISINVIDATCGYANGSAVINVNGSTGPYTFAWDDANNSTDSFAINLTGNQTYNVTITDSNNCVITDTVFVPNIAGPTASAVTDQNVCAGSTNGSIDLTVIGGTAPFAFDWNSGSYNTEDISGLSAGTYAVVITDSNSCVAIVVQFVDTFPSPVITLASTNPLCSDSNGSVIASIVSGTSPYTFAWSNGATDSTLTNLSAAIYQLTITDGNGCIDIDSIVLSTTPAVTATAISTSATCNQANGTADLTVTSGSTPYTFSWSNGATDEDISGLLPTSYNALVTDSAGCTANVAVTVANANGPNATFTSTDASCNTSNGTVDVSVTGGIAPYTFTWSNGATDEDVSSLTSGTYNATISDSTGCQTTISIIINNVAGPSANYTITNATCGFANGAADVSVTGGATPYAYTWSNASTNEDIDSVLAGTYAVTISDANNCETSLSFPIANVGGATFSLNPSDATCGNANGAVALNAGNGTLPYSFIWSNGATTEDLSNVTAGQYSVTLTDANSCQTIDTATVNNTGASVVTLAVVYTTCGLDNGSVTSSISGGTVPYNFTWSNGETTQNISNLAAGTYTVSVTDANSCVTVETQNVGGSTAPNAALTMTPEICGNANGTITTAVSAGTLPYTFAWYSGSTDQNLDSLTAGLYALTITDSVGCTASASISVDFVNGPQLSISATNSTCELPNGLVGMNITGGSSSYVILWNNGATTQNLSNIYAGTYNVTVTDSLGCQVIDSVLITTTQTPDIDYTAVQPSCGMSNGAITVSAANGQPAYDFLWSNGATNTTQSNLSQGIYYITLTDQSGCKDTATVNLNPSNGPQLIANALPDTVCAGGMVMLTVSGAQSYSWTPSTNLNQATGDTVYATLTSSTTFTVTGYDSLGCMATQQIAVTVHQLPIIPSIAPAAVCEGNSATLTVNGVDNYTWIGNNIIQTNGNQVTVQPTTTSTYIVTAVDQWGCVSSDSAIVTVNTLPILNVNINDGSLCIGEQANITITGANAYSWYPNTGLTLVNDSTAVAAPTTPVNYFIVGTNGAGCVDTAEVFVMVFAPPVITVNPPNPTICELSSTVMTASGADLYSWSPSLGLSATTGDQVTASPGVETTYTVIGSNADGCTASATATIFIGDNLTLSLSPAYPEMCIGGSVSLTMLGAEQYTWTPSVTPVDSTYSQVTVSPSVTTTYTVVGSDAGGCTGTMDVVVTVHSLPTVTANNATICNGSSAMLYASGASYYQWTPTASLNTGFADSVIATPSVTTTYTVYGTTAQGCLDTAQVVVTVTSYPIATIDSIPNIYCDASSPVTLSAQPVGGVFSGAGVSGNTFDPAAAGPGFHQVVYTYSNGSGCTASDTVSLQVDQTPTVITTNGKVCNGDSSSLTASGASTYTWLPSTGLNNTNGATVIASGTASLTYTIIGTSAFGCSDTAYSTYTVDQLPVVTMNAINPGYCANASAVTLSASPVGGTFSGNGVSGNTFTPSTAGNGTYNIIYSYTDMNGCSAADTQQVTVNAVPNVTVNNATMCQGQTATLNANGAVAYNWSPTNSLSSGTGATVITNAMNPTQVVVTGVDVNGCSASSTAVINVNPVPELTVNNATPSACAGNSFTIIAGGATLYQWSPAIGITPTTGNTVVASPNTSTTYTVIGMNGFGCSDTLAIPFTVLTAPAAVAGPDAQICEGNSTQLSAIATGSVVWIPDTGLDNAFINEPVASPLQTTTYTVNVVDANGCTASDAVIVTVINTANIEATGGGIVCLGNSAQLHATGGVDYQWSPSTYLSSTTGDNVTSTPGTSITYTVTANNSLGCPATDTVVVDVKLPINIQAGAGAQVCLGESYQLSASGTGLTYEWTPASGLDNPYVPYPNATPQSTTTYTVTTSDGVCFTASATVVVDVTQPPYLGIASTQITVVAGTGQQLFAQGSGTFEWSPPTGLSCTDCPDPIANPTQPTTYTVTVTDSSGCRAEGNISIDFLCDENGIYIPNAFTPNGDGKNDEFLIRGYGIKEITVFRVFSRWGELMFETTNAEEGWDGTFKGEPQFPAVYVYYVEGLCTNDQKIVKQGNVTLIR